MFRRNLNKTPAASADQAQARPSMDNSPQRVAWSDNPDEIDPYSPRGGSATPRQRLTENAVNGQNWLHQQRSEPQEPSTPLQISPYHHQAQQAMIPRANPASPKLQPSPQPPRQSPRFFASSASNQEPMQSQPSASSALSGGSSVGSGRDLPPASFFAEQAHAASGSVFGEDFVGEVKEVFYIRQRPTVPQPGDGIIRSPVAGGTRHDWHDAFKIDYNGREMTLKDLPSKDAILFIKKRPVFNTYNIYAGGSVSGAVTATVKKASGSGSSKLSISLEGQGHVKYEAEGDFSEFVYSISRSGEKVAQVLRDEEARSAVTSRHAYGVHVAANTDCALILAIVMIAEEMGREKDLHLMSRASN